MIEDIHKLRKEYSSISLSDSVLPSDPVALFSDWFNNAIDCEISEPNAMALATASKEGIPSVRFVLLKGFDQGGFKFFTNSASQKGRELHENPNAALAFYWEPLERQVRISGKVEKLQNSESEAYFHKRPIGAQIAATISEQSRHLGSMGDLENSFRALENLLDDNISKLPLPPSWGGYCLRPVTIEFWKGRTNRLHERLLYSRSQDFWQRTWLQP